jgi:hypothetical protein
MRVAIDDIFKPASTNETIYEAYKLVSRNWLEFGEEAIDSWANQKKGFDPDFDIKGGLILAKKHLAAFEVEDSVKGLITFLMNRVAWDSIEDEKATMNNFRGLIKFKAPVQFFK